jgi:hypothetical protein
MFSRTCTLSPSRLIRAGATLSLPSPKFGNISKVTRSAIHPGEDRGTSSVIYPNWLRGFGRLSAFHRSALRHFMLAKNSVTRSRQHDTNKAKLERHLLCLQYNTSVCTLKRLAVNGNKREDIAGFEPKSVSTNFMVIWYVVSWTLPFLRGETCSSD